jgi:phosphoglycerate dehydrogenase-like enzyme
LRGAERPEVRVVILNDFPPGYYAELPQSLAPLSGRASVQIYDREAASTEELADWLAGAQAAIDIRARSRFEARLFEQLPALRVLVVRGTTAPLVDEEAADRFGVAVCNTPYQSTEAVSEYSIALLFAASRHIPLTHQLMQRGEWQHKLGFQLAGKTLGIIGLGMIGQATARLGRALGMRVLVWSQTYDPERAAACGGELVELETLLRTSDAVSLHLRLSDRSRGIIGRRELVLLKDGAVFVNTARAGLLDEQALIEELQSGRIIGALDVFSQEPIPADHPLIGLDNVVMTSHAAWSTREVYEDRTRVPVGLVLDALDGRPRNVINPKALEHPAWQAILAS